MKINKACFIKEIWYCFAIYKNIILNLYVKKDGNKILQFFLWK